MVNDLESNGLSPLRCSSCGRFLGLMLILCKNCKSWSIVAEGETGSTLTTEEIYNMLPVRGQKV